MSKKVITRFAPSPTGALHIGGVRTALFNYLYAKHNNGDFILRIEDTDKERSDPAHEKGIVESLEWVGINRDNKDLIRQSERTEIYRAKIKELIDSGNAYEAEESKDGTGKVIRFKNPNSIIAFNDLIRGGVRVDTTDLKDFVIAKNLDEPLYHLTVVIDDAASEVTHVIRAEEHISNTPRQILILEALGFARPTYAHLPLVLAPDKTKLSKRHGAVSAVDYKEAGYLPEAVANYLGLLGWHPTDDREIFSMDELIKEFEIERVQKSGAVFDTEKLKSINKHYLGLLSDDEYKSGLKIYLGDRLSDPILDKVLPLLRERLNVYKEVVELYESGELDYYAEKPKYEASGLIWKDSDAPKTAKHLKYTAEKLDGLSDNEFNQESIKGAIWDYATEEGRGAVLWPMRFALSGKEKSPDPFILAEILGKKETIERLEKASGMLS